MVRISRRRYPYPTCRFFDFMSPRADDARVKPRAPTPPPVLSPQDQRIHVRFDHMFPVVVGSELYGDSPAIARNVSTGGMLVEMAFPLPLGSVVTVHFTCAREEGDPDEIVARAEVKHHYCLNFAGGGEPAATRAIGLRFLDFDADLPPERLLDRWTRAPLLH
jgi:hypothetical protein